MTIEIIDLTDERDVRFAYIAQGALVFDTVLPSGLKTPERPMIVSGARLRTPYDFELSKLRRKKI